MKRRKFLQNIGLASSSFCLHINGIPVSNISSVFASNKLQENDKKLVIVQLFGGNDGLNTLIPYEDDIYHKSRPKLRIEKEKVIKMNHTLGFHPQMSTFDQLFKEGKVNIIQNVGYHHPNRSHFRSVDIWKSGSDSDEYIYDGWTARYLNQQKEDSLENLNYPLAIELGWAGSMLLENNNIPLGIYMGSLGDYFSLTKDGSVSTGSVLGTKAEDALNYINTVAKQSFRYSATIKQASETGKVSTEYPKSSLAKQLSTISQLISGGLKTSVYVAKLKGFDTHYDQLETHPYLLKEVSEAIAAFQKDIELQNMSDKITVLVFSEFGRRVKENANGTDHGTAAPIFVIGKSVRGGIIGRNPDLNNLDENGDLHFKYDFRQVYSTILKDHFSLTDSQTNSILNKEYSTLPIFKNSIENFPEEYIILEQNFPNPVNTITNIRYTLYEVRRVKLDLLDNKGNVIRNLVNDLQTSGIYTVKFDASTLPSGVYFYRLLSDQYKQIKRMVVIR